VADRIIRNPIINPPYRAPTGDPADVVCLECSTDLPRMQFVERSDLTSRLLLPFARTCTRTNGPHSASCRLASLGANYGVGSGCCRHLRRYGGRGAGDGSTNGWD
jgi:hypothetical protein